MSDIINVIGKEEYNEQIKEGLVLVDFWASWCGPCQMLAPILHEFKTDVGDKVKVLKVNVDENEEIAYSLKIASIPTLLLYKDGELVEKSVGLTSKAGLSQLVLKHI